MSDPNTRPPRRSDDTRLGATVTTPVAHFGTPQDTMRGDTTLRRRGVLPGESSLHIGTLPGGVPIEKMQQAARYQILERIGRVGMAPVFKANDPTIGRDVAIKFLHASLCEGEDHRARFLQEARAAGGLWKMTDSPGAMLVMPVSESAAAGDSELSCIFQPLMSTARAPVLVTSNQSAR